MTLERLAGACVLPGFDGLEPPDELLRRVEDGLGGVVLFAKNIRDHEQLAELTRRLDAARPEVLIATDEEGGDVTRLEAATGSSYPGNLALGAVDDVELTRSVAAAMGTELAAVGVNLDLAPVADVNTNPANPVIGVRSFGANPQLVSRHVAAFVDGLQGAGVAACAKHFPGHGDTSTDSHLELPVAGGRLEEHLLPFRAAIDAGVAAIMTAHVVVPELGGEPATINPAAVRLLRDELGFDGVLVSDALEMRAVAGLVGAEEAAVRALEAGVDALCLGHDLPLEPIVAAIAGALESGRLSHDRIGEATARLARIGNPRPASNGAPTSLVGAEAARRGLRVEGDVTIRSDPLVIELAPAANIAASRAGPWLDELVRQRWPEGQFVRLTPGSAPPELDRRPLVVVLRDAGRHAWQQDLVTRLLEWHEDVVLVETGVPGWAPEGPRGLLATYGAGRANLEAAVERLAPRP
jgi:beta-N-acetylhexosaminidase